ncbi:MAG: hypothetical protein ACHQJ6_01615, partial [Candidatus Berkiellales bacterium]
MLQQQIINRQKKIRFEINWITHPIVQGLAIWTLCYFGHRWFQNEFLRFLASNLFKMTAEIAVNALKLLLGVSVSIPTMISLMGWGIVAVGLSITIALLTDTIRSNLNKSKYRSSERATYVLVSWGLPILG